MSTIRARRLFARESAGHWAEYTLHDEAGAIVDISGWTFDQVFARQAGAADVTLAMAAEQGDEGFFILDGPAGVYEQRILPATLAGVDDETGDFTMRGDIVATLADASRVLIEDQELHVTEGTTP